MDNVDDYLLPVGFKELLNYLNSRQSKMVKAKEIQKELAYKYGFSSGKVAGTIKRAEEKGIISRVGRGVYKYDGDNEKKSRSPLSQKATPAKSASSDVPEKRDIQAQINDEITQTIKRINALVGPELTNLSIEDFQKVKDKISSLEEIIRKK